MRHSRLTIFCLLNIFPIVKSNFKFWLVTKSGKIPAWDLKRRVEANENTIRFMENENSELKQQQQLYNDRLLALEAEATQRQELVHSKDVDLQKNTQELERLKSSLR